MSRTILIILALAAIVLLVLLATNVLNVNQTREAELPNVSGGQLPAFDVDANGAALDSLGEEVEETAEDAGNAVENVNVPDVDVDVDADANRAN